VSSYSLISLFLKFFVNTLSFSVTVLGSYPKSLNSFFNCSSVGLLVFDPPKIDESYSNLYSASGFCLLSLFVRIFSMSRLKDSARSGQNSSSNVESFSSKSSSRFLKRCVTSLSLPSLRVSLKYSIACSNSTSTFPGE
jgi:hypothetical protein